MLIFAGILEGIFFLIIQRMLDCSVHIVWVLIAVSLGIAVFTEPHGIMELNILEILTLISIVATAYLGKMLMDKFWRKNRKEEK